jgi:hypothetical protein
MIGVAVRSFLGKVFKQLPMGLDFPRCGHEIPISRPPYLSSRGRWKAVEQAKLIPCPDCDYRRWDTMIRGNVNPELLAALGFVWRLRWLGSKFNIGGGGFN